MTRRADQPETPADRALRECIAQDARQCFVMVAGAGSGKTTSLIKALAATMEVHRTRLKRHRQRIACITYTEIAAGEIWADVGTNALIHVSTIHSFLWMITRSFQSDIRAWVRQRIEDKLRKLREESAAFGPRVQVRTREKNRRDTGRYERDLALVANVPYFTYGVGSNYGEGVLGHDDVLKMATTFLSGRPLLRTLVAQQFPFVFVDESQDTAPEVVEALKAITSQMGAQFCLGFFGDPMQQIYPTGIGTIVPCEGWRLIQKPENFRCSATVLAVANAIRRDGDGLVQSRGRMTVVHGAPQPVLGTARVFVLPADCRRDERLCAVRGWIADRNRDDAWRPGPGEGVKVLVIVHRMAAARLGFADLYAALNDKAPDAFKERFLDASAWPLRPFMTFVLPVCDALRDHREFELMTLLRTQCPQLARDNISGRDVAALLAELRSHTNRLADMMNTSSRRTTRDVLLLLRDAHLVPLDPRYLAYLDERPTAPAEAEGVDEDDTGVELAAMDRFLDCPASQFWPYRTYVSEQSPFSTQQGIKGAEFERVLVVLDDDEGTHAQFSYDKYFGIAALSPRDRENIQARVDNTVFRTRRLFYVCCTRALSDLVVVLFSTDVATAERKVREANIFAGDAIHTLADLPTA